MSRGGEVPPRGIKEIVSPTGIEPVTDGYSETRLQSTALPTELQRDLPKGDEIMV